MSDNTAQDNEYNPGEFNRSYESKMQVKPLGVKNVPKEKYPGSHRKTKLVESIPADVWLVFDFPVGKAEIFEKKIETGWLEPLLTKLDEEFPFVDEPVMKGCPRGLLREYWPQNQPTTPQVLLIGFTDRVGEEERNRRLRKDRAWTLKRYMELLDPSLPERLIPIDLYIGGPLGWLIDPITRGLNDEERRKMNRCVAVYRLHNVITWTTQLRQANYVRNRENRPQVPKSVGSGVHRAGVVDDAIRKLEDLKKKGDTSEETKDLLCMLKKVQGQKLHDRRHHDIYMTWGGINQYLEDMHEFYVKEGKNLVEIENYAMKLPEVRERIIIETNEFQVASGNSFRSELNWLICRSRDLDHFLNGVKEIRLGMIRAIGQMYSIIGKSIPPKDSPEQAVLDWLYSRINNYKWQGKRAASSIWNCFPVEGGWPGGRIR